jgi:hypothetical protein
MPDIFVSKKTKVKKSKKPPKVSRKKGKRVSTASKKPKDYKSLLKDPNRCKFPGHTHNPLAAYSYLPDKVSFINEDPEEEVILLVRKHPITNMGWILISFMMIIVPSFVTVLTPMELLPGEFQFVLSLVWYLIASAFILEQFLSWFFHVNIITDERIIEVDFMNLVYREITDANIDKIEDVTVEVGGSFRTIFHYGDVIIQTAAQVPKIEFEAVPNPDKVAKVLRELRVEEEQEKLEGRVR